MPEVASFADDKDFVKKIEMIKQDPSKLSEHLQDEKIKTYLTVALQYQTFSQMSPEERAKLVQKQEEMRMKREKVEEVERERKRKLEKEQKEAEEKKKKEEELSKLSTGQKKALDLKETANKLYTEKLFNEALPLYEEASKLDPSNIVYLNNICAVHLELKNYQKTIEIGNSAVETGRANHAPFEQIGRALQRIGTAYSRLNDFENAILYLQNIFENSTKAGRDNAISALSRIAVGLNLNFSNNESIFTKIVDTVLSNTPLSHDTLENVTLFKFISYVSDKLQFSHFEQYINQILNTVKLIVLNEIKCGTTKQIIKDVKNYLELLNNNEIMRVHIETFINTMSEKEKERFVNSIRNA